MVEEGAVVSDECKSLAGSVKSALAPAPVSGAAASAWSVPRAGDGSAEERAAAVRRPVITAALLLLLPPTLMLLPARGAELLPLPLTSVALPVALGATTDDGALVGAAGAAPPAMPVSDFPAALDPAATPAGVFRAETTRDGA